MSLLRAVVEHFVAPPGDRRPDAIETFRSPGDGASGACPQPAPRMPAGVAGDRRPDAIETFPAPGEGASGVRPQPAPRMPAGVAGDRRPDAIEPSASPGDAASDARPQQPAPRMPAGVASDRRPDAIEPFPAPGEGASDPRPQAAPHIPPGVALLAAPRDAHALGAALGLALAGHRRAPVAVLCVWTAGPGAGPAWGVPARPAARRLATALTARGHEARAAGRLVVVRLPAQADEAAVQARRAAAAAGSAPSVLALGGPRVAAFDALLAEQDLVVVAAPSGTDPALARLALAGLQSATARACVCEVPPAHPARTVAAAGLTLLPSARRAIAGTVEALS